MSKRPRSRLTPINSGLTELLGNERMALLVAITRIRKAWRDIVGPMMAERTEPVRIEPLAEGNCLWIAVDHPIMSQQIRFLRDDIRKACFREARLDSLIKVRTQVQDGAGIKAKPKKERQPVSFTDKRTAAKELAMVRDKALRRAMFEARIAQIAYGEA